MSCIHTDFKTWFIAANAALDTHIYIDTVYTDIMPCKKLTSLTGCNECKYYVDNKELLGILRPEAMSRLCLYIVQDEKLETKFIDDMTVVVYCSGIVIFNYLTPPDTNTKYKTFRKNVDIISRIVERWCTVNSPQADTLAGCSMTNIKANIYSLTNIQSLRHYFLCLTKHLRDLTICNGVCEYITTSKETSNCSFSLAERSDVKKITDPLVILDALKSAMYAQIKSGTENVYIDIHSIRISCAGDIILPFKYVHSKYPIKFMVEKSVDVLRFWIGRHRYRKDSDIMLEVLDACTHAKNSNELYVIFRNGEAKLEAGMFFDD